MIILILALDIDLDLVVVRVRVRVAVLVFVLVLVIVIGIVPVLVLVHDGSSWCRALVTKVKKDSVALENVDTGGKLSVVKAALYQVPSKVASLHSLSVSCCLAGITAGSNWDETALQDWTRMVEGKTLVLVIRVPLKLCNQLRATAASSMSTFRRRRARRL